MSDKLAFEGEVFKVQTLVDGGVRVTLDLPENAIGVMAALAACRQKGLWLLFEVSEANPPQPEGADEEVDYGL